MKKTGRVQTPEEMRHDDEVLFDTFARAAELDRWTGPIERMGWRGSMYVWLRWHFWHKWARHVPARVRDAMPEEGTLKYLTLLLGIVGAAVGIGVGLLTLAEKWRALP